MRALPSLFRRNAVAVITNNKVASLLFAFLNEWQKRELNSYIRHLGVIHRFQDSLRTLHEAHEEKYGVDDMFIEFRKRNQKQLQDMLKHTAEEQEALVKHGIPVQLLKALELLIVG